MRIRTVVEEDNPLVREGFLHLLGRHEAFEVSVTGDEIDAVAEIPADASISRVRSLLE